MSNITPCLELLQKGFIIVTQTILHRVLHRVLLIHQNDQVPVEYQYVRVSFGHMVYAIKYYYINNIFYYRYIKKKISFLCIFYFFCSFFFFYYFIILSFYHKIIYYALISWEKKIKLYYLYPLHH